MNIYGIPGSPRPSPLSCFSSKLKVLYPKTCESCYSRFQKFIPKMWFPAKELNSCKDSSTHLGTSLILTLFNRCQLLHQPGDLENYTNQHVNSLGLILRARVQTGGRQKSSGDSLAEFIKDMGDKLIFVEWVGSEQVGSCVDRWPELREEQVDRPAKEPFCGLTVGRLKGWPSQIMKDFKIQADTCIDKWNKGILQRE